MARDWNGQDLVNEFSAALSDTSTAFKTKVLAWINEIQRDICARHDWDFLKAKGKKVFEQTSTTAGTVDITCVFPDGNTQNALDDVTLTFANQTISDTFDTDTATYDSDKVEYSSGQYQQTNQRPTDGVMGATYTSSTSLSWSDAGLTPIASNGSPTVSGGALNMIGSGAKDIDYTPTGIIDEFTIRMLIKPNYSGSPTDDQVFCYTGTDGGSNNFFKLYHSTAGKLGIVLANESASFKISGAAGESAWSPTAGTTYEIEANMKTGSSEVYIDGTRVVNNTAAWTRAIGDVFRIGSGSVQTETDPQFEVLEWSAYDAKKHTGASYTAPSTGIPEGDYVESTVTLTQKTLANQGSYTSFAATTTGTPKFIFDDKYWDGSAWSTSSDTYATAATEALSNTNLSSFTFNSTTTSSISEEQSLLIAKPGACTATLATEAGGSLTASTAYIFYVTFCESVSGAETQAGDASISVTTTTTEKTIFLTSIPTSSDPLVNKRRIYIKKGSADPVLHTTMNDNTVTTLTISADSSSTIEPPDEDYIRKLYGNLFFESGPSRQLEYKPIEQIRLFDEGAISSGSPTYWSVITRDRVLLDPKPSVVTYPISFYYYKVPAEIYNEATSYPVLPKWMKPVLRAGVMYLGYEYRDRDGQESKINNYYELISNAISRMANPVKLPRRVRDVVGNADGFEL